MKLITSVLGTASAVAVASAVAFPTAALAQYGPTSAPQQTAVPTQASPSESKGRKLTLSPKAQKAILDLQTAVKAKNAAAIPGLLAAAQAVAKTPDDRYAIGTMQLQAAIDASDYPALVAAADVIMANGGTAAEAGKIYLFAAQHLAAAKQYAPAATALDRLVAVDPNNSDALLLRSEMLFQQQRVPESIASLTSAIDKAKAAHQTVPENWYQVRLGRAYNAKLPSAYGFSRDWVAAYPSPVHWRDTINIYRNLSGQNRQQLIDMLRLARATKSLSGEADYTVWAQSLSDHGYPAEALALVQEGEAAGALKLTSPGIAPFVASVRRRAPEEKAALLITSKAALSDPTAKSAMRAGDGYFDAGDYAQAATLYRAAIGKTGVDKDLANLRLGMALAMSGDKAGATAALQSVGGAQAEVAKYWLTYVATRA
ncbi:MAG: tetratricopeptide repeat protein [Sphingomicrobium sp.]|nr:tetratricopeptide repeat protein [Sphingomonadales bacterium]